MRGIIYKLTNKLTGQIYIGQTVDLRARMAAHLCSETLVGEALRTHGVDRFLVETLTTCDSKDQLDNRERFYITLFDCMSPKGYNLNGGGNGVGISEETRRKKSLAMIGKNKGKPGPKGKKWSEEARQRLSQRVSGSGSHMYGKKRPEHSLLMKGDKNPSRRPEVNLRRAESIRLWWQKRKEGVACAP